MQPNDPRQQSPGYPNAQPGQPQPYQPQPGAVPPQPPQFAQPAYGAQNQPNPYAQQSQPVAPPYGAPQQQPYLSPLEPSAQQFQPLPSPPQNSGGTGKKALIIGLIVLVLLALGVGGYLLLANSNTTKTPTTTKPKTSSSANPKTPKTSGSFDALSNFTLAAPSGAALRGMTATVPTSPDAYTTLATSDGSCTIGSGVLSQTALPGTDLNSLIAIKIAEAKKQDTHIEVSGPTMADSLILKDTAGKTYALPAASFILTDTTTGGGTINELYSAVELKDKSHAVVYIACNSDKPNDTSLAAKVNNLLPVAQAITIQPAK